MAVPMKYLYHAVRFGRDNVRSCIFLQWPDAEPHVLGYNDGTAAASVPASQCRTYDDLEDAVIYLGHDPFSVKAPEDTGPRCYHAVRVGRGVRSCIFLNWHDASQHVVCVEAVYQTFEDPAEALVYLGGDPNPPFNRHRFIGSVHGVANADATLQLTETRKRRREDGNNSGEEEHSQGEEEEQKDEQEILDVAAAGEEAASKDRKQTSADGESITVTSPASKQPDVSCSPQEGSSPSTTKTEFFISFEWDEMWERLKRFKEDNGSINISFEDGANIDVRRWLWNECEQIRTLKRRPVGDVSLEIEVERKQRKLEELGVKFAMPVGDPKGLSLNWIAKWEMLRWHKEMTGTVEISVADRDSTSLRKWLYSQRYRIQQVKDNSTKMTPIMQEKKVMLEELGVTMDNDDSDGGGK